MRKAARKAKSSRYVRLPPVELPQTLEVAIQDYHDWADSYFRNVESRSRITTALYPITTLICVAWMES
jgi:hypothetical protein